MIDINAPLQVPAVPPEPWFHELPPWWNPDDQLIQVGLTGSDTGRVAALVAPYGTGYLGQGPNGRRWTAPFSRTNYEFAHIGSTLADDGTDQGHMVRTAAIAGGIDHASEDPTLTLAEVLHHYNANTDTRLMRGRYQDIPDVGIVYLGAMDPGHTVWDAVSLMSGGLSGDWRYVDEIGGHELTGAQLVNNPAFRPIPQNTQRSRFAITAALGSGYDDPTAPLFGDWQPDHDPAVPTDDDRLILAALADINDRLDVFEQAMIVMLEETVTDEDDSDDTHHDIFLSVYGCPHCGGEGCDHCGGTGLAAWSQEDDNGIDLPDMPPVDPDAKPYTYP